MADIDEEEVKLESLKEEGFPLSVIYCGVCKLPPEYCEYGSTLKECRDWLKVNQPSLFEKFGDAPAELISNEVTVEEVKEEGENKPKEDNEEPKKEVKFEEPPKPNNNNNKKKKKGEEEKKIKISVSQRNKKKFITSVSGLSHFDIKAKEASKFFANKYACGAAVVNGPNDTEIIDIQGDVVNNIANLITTKWKHVTPESIIFVEEKKKGK